MYLLPADAAGGEEEPVHEDAGAVVVGVIGQHAVPLVLLLTGTVSGAAEGQGAAKSSENEKDILVYFRRDSRADLLVDGLLELLVVEDGPHLAVAVARPKGGDHINSGLTHILSGKLPELCWNVNCLKTLLSATVVVFYWTRIVGLSFISAVHCSVVLVIFFSVIQGLKKFLVRSLEDISPEPGK